MHKSCTSLPLLVRGQSNPTNDKRWWWTRLLPWRHISKHTHKQPQIRRTEVRCKLCSPLEWCSLPFLGQRTTDDASFCIHTDKGTFIILYFFLLVYPRLTARRDPEHAYPLDSSLVRAYRDHRNEHAQKKKREKFTALLSMGGGGGAEDTYTTAALLASPYCLKLKMPCFLCSFHYTNPHNTKNPRATSCIISLSYEHPGAQQISL